MVIVNLPVHLHVDVHVYVHDGERAIRSEERVSRQKLDYLYVEYNYGF